MRNERCARGELVQILRPFEWTFTGQDLNRVLAEVADREPQLQLAASRSGLPDTSTDCRGGAAHHRHGGVDQEHEQHDREKPQSADRDGGPVDTRVGHGLLDRHGGRGGGENWTVGAEPSAGRASAIAGDPAAARTSPAASVLIT